MKKLLFILIGNELTSGKIADKNAAYFIRKHENYDLSPDEIRIIPDDREKIISVISESIGKFALIITSGGLGPTSDDITTECIAEACNKKLYLDPASEKRLRDKYASRSRPVHENSLKQSKFPEGCIIFPNEVGTADSFCLTSEKNNQKTHIISLPGVPKEFRHYIDNSVGTWILKELELSITGHSEHLRLFGLSEAFVGNLIGPLSKNSDNSENKEITIAYRPQFPEILLSVSSNKENSERLCKETITKIYSLLPNENIISSNYEEGVPLTTFQLLNEHKKTISYAESCTGGKVSSEITKFAGSSEVFLGAVVSYSNQSKTKFLDVPTELIKRVGAVSPEVAEEMARAVRIKMASSFGVSITGIAGPANGSASEKPVGLIYIGFSSEAGTTSFKFNLPWERRENQIYASYLALDIIRRTLLGLPLSFENR